MKKITYLLSYYNQADCLKYTLGVWRDYPQEVKDLIHFQIIDDHSKELPAKPVIDEEDTEGLSLSLYRVEDDLVCNISGCRNLGARLAETEYIMILDMDTIIHGNIAKELLKLIEKDKRLKSKSYSCAHRFEHPAVCMMKTEDYWKIGGCEEVLVGHYGYTDHLFWLRNEEGRIVDIKKHVLLGGESPLELNEDGVAPIIRDPHHNHMLIRKHAQETEAERGEEDFPRYKWSNDYVRFGWTKLI